MNAFQRHCVYPLRYEYIRETLYVQVYVQASWKAHKNIKQTETESDKKGKRKEQEEVAAVDQREGCSKRRREKSRAHVTSSKRT